MNRIRKEIESAFAYKSGLGAYEISSLDPEVRAWAFNDGTEYGVMLEYHGKDFYETFAGAKMYKAYRSLGSQSNIELLILSCSDISLRNQFSCICEDFVDPGDDNSRRSRLLKNPLAWWMEWRELIGNIMGGRQPYDVLAELLVLEKLIEDGVIPEWHAVKKGSHDIETEACAYEVKSTIMKTSSVIHASSQFQFIADRPLYLVFTRMEESEHGRSIDEVMACLENHIPEKIGIYESYLSDLGLPKGYHARQEKFTVLERRLLQVDENFPKITEAEFKDEKIPGNIVHIEYDIDLDGLDYVNWK